MSKKIIVIVGLCLGKEIPNFLQDPNNIIYGFEPQRESFEIVKRKYGNQPRVHIFNEAVSNENTTKKFHACEYGATSSLGGFTNQESINKWNKLSPCKKIVKQTREVYDVKCVRLDTFMDENKLDHIDYLQVDAQGHDYHVLLSLGEKIRNIRKIQVEIFYSSVKLYNDQTPSEKFDQLFSMYNFRLVSRRFSKYKQFSDNLYVNNIQ
jgi:FkbM family methyltransferase